MNNLNRYIDTLERQYRAGTNNHEQHNSNPDYWNILLGPIKENPSAWEHASALDFGCGKGRNVTNLHSLANWKAVDGVDISQENINFCIQSNIPKSNFTKNNGEDLRSYKENTYNFIMSTICFQHLCSYTLRYNLISEIYRILVPNGMFSLQMGFNDGLKINHSIRSYNEDYLDADGSNGINDVTVNDPMQLKNDFDKIGFKFVSYTISHSWQDVNHPKWIYIKGTK